ncbi:hypothetical protein JCM31598_15590 [Desulfonatronum parangueonense]
MLGELNSFGGAKGELDEMEGGYKKNPYDSWQFRGLGIPKRVLERQKGVWMGEECA